MSCVKCGAPAVSDYYGEPVCGAHLIGPPDTAPSAADAVTADDLANKIADTWLQIMDDNYPQPSPAQPAEKVPGVSNLEFVCETCGNLGITPEGLCIDCEWRREGIRVAMAYREKVDKLAAQVEALTEEWDELQRQRRNWLDNDTTARALVSQEKAIEALEGRLKEATMLLDAAMSWVMPDTVSPSAAAIKALTEQRDADVTALNLKDDEIARLREEGLKLAAEISVLYGSMSKSVAKRVAAQTERVHRNCITCTCKEPLPSANKGDE